MLMKRYISIISIVLFAITATAQDGHIRYKEQGNTKEFGRQVMFRTDAANLDTLTSVYSGTVAYDTTERVVKYHNGSNWQSVATGTIRDTTISLSSVEILALYTTPKDAILAPGAGYVVDVLNASAGITFVSAAYATNVSISIITETATRPQFKGDVFDATTTRITHIDRLAASAVGQTQLIENKKVVITVDGGDPTTGDGTAKIYLQYRLIEL